MKRTKYISLALIIFLLGSVTHIKAYQPIYVYLHNGGIEAFMTYDIDSIVYSNYDADSVWHEEYQSQDIWTQDSTYRYPIGLVDSVSFVTPQTEYKSGVINLSDNLMDYVISSDSLTILFMLSTPSELLPKPSDKLATLEMNSKFPAGFAGEAVSVTTTQDGIVVECTLADLQDIFETLYQVSSVYGYQEEDKNMLSPRRLRPIDYSGEEDFELEPYELSLWDIDTVKNKLTENSHLALHGKSSASVKVSPQFHVKTLLIISKTEGYYMSYSVTGDINVHEEISLYGSIEDFSWKKPIPNTRLKIAIAPLTFFYLQPGVYFNADLTVSLHAEANQYFKLYAMGDVSSQGRNVLKPLFLLKQAGHDEKSEGTLDGSAEFGDYLDVGLTFLDQNLDRINIRGSMGVKFGGHFVLMDNDIIMPASETKTYEKMKDSHVEAHINASLGLYAAIVNKETTLAEWKDSKKIKQWDLVPAFSDVSLTSLSKTSAFATMTLSGDCLFPVNYGFAVKDADGVLNDFIAPNKFDNGSKVYSHTFSTLKENTPYTLYPKIEWMGFEFLASPTAELEEKEWVKITDFAITYSAYSKQQEFEYKGNMYSYKYNCTTTVNLLDTTNIIDWGYIYIDPNGDTTFISLTEFNLTEYSDDRYTYYRNNSNDSVILAGYVQFRNSDSKEIGKSHSFPIVFNHYCSDNNHPHMIDLGLTSGTMWACHNLGASKPEDYGSYYAYAETTAKSSFRESNYLYFYYDYQFDGLYSYYESIGGNVAGFGVTIGGKLGYDAVTADNDWEDGWRMPTKDEMQELIDSCLWTWTEKEGIIGYQVTGPNGNSIFLPASGGRVEGTNYQGDPDKMTFYRTDEWSSKQMGNKGFGYTYGLRFNQSAYTLSDACAKAWGYVIRPVMPKQ